MIAPLLAALALAAPCDAADTRATVTAFTRAWNTGDLRAVDRLVAREPVFKWFSSGTVGRRLGTAAYSRATLVRYVARRHALDDRIVIRSFRFNGSDVREDGPYGHFEYRALRVADDHATVTVAGKGAVNCSRATAIAVWSMA